MSAAPRNVLVVGVTHDEFARVSPFLSRRDFTVDRFPGADGALELTATVPFELLVVRVPLPGIEVERFLEHVRSESSLCAHASIVLLETEDSGRAMGDEPERLIGRGANRVIKLADSRDEVQRIVAELIDVAPRKAARFLARLEVKLGGAKDLILCQTENLSSTGMLIRTERRYQNGVESDFEFAAPDEPRPIKGTARIVRRTMIGRDSVGGVGVTFVAWEGDSQRRYQRMLGRL